MWRALTFARDIFGMPIPDAGPGLPDRARVIVATATIMAAIRWRQDAHLFAIACVASGLGVFGWRARGGSDLPRRRRAYSAFS